MSKNAKNARKLAKKRAMKGQKGPAKTTPAHGKKNAWFQKKDANGRLIKANKKKAVTAND